MKQWGSAFSEGREVTGFVVRDAVNPAAPEDADPLEGKSADGGIVGSTFFAVALVESIGPEGSRDGLFRPLDERLADERRAREAPVDPGVVAASLGDGGDADVLLEGSCVGDQPVPAMPCSTHEMGPSFETPAVLLSCADGERGTCLLSPEGDSD